MTRVPIIDLHNDLLLELDERGLEQRPFATHWLEQLRAGGLRVQVCSLFTARPEWTPELCLRRALRQVRAFARVLGEHGDDVTAIRTRADVTALDADGFGLLLSMEGADALGEDPELIDVFHALGVRMVALTWNHRNAFADGCAEPSDGGLSRRGKDLVKRLESLHVAIDLAHASERTFFAVLESSPDSVVLVSHGACRSVHDIPRNLSDDQLRALAERDGVLGMALLPLMTDPGNPTIERLLGHFDHAVELMGIEHVALGADFFAQVSHALGRSGAPGTALGAPEPYPSVGGLRGPGDFPRLLRALGDHGYAEAAIRAIAGDNARRLLLRALPD